MKVVLLCLVTLPVLAQQTRPAVVRTTISRKAFTADTPPEERAEEQTKALTGQLLLSPKQVEQVWAISLLKAQAQQTMLRQYDAGSLSGSLSEESQRISQEFETKLAAICTPAQRQKRQRLLALFQRLKAQADMSAPAIKKQK